MYHYKATVNRVIDGDTVDMIMDLGFGVSKLVRIRLADIGAPEVKGDERLRVCLLRLTLKVCFLLALLWRSSQRRTKTLVGAAMSVTFF